MFQYDEEVASLNRKLQMTEEKLESTEERLEQANEKFEQTSQAADESERWVCQLGPAQYNYSYITL